MKKKLLIFSIILIIIDQLSKLFIINNFDVDTGIEVIPSFFSILYIRNTGAAWGIFSSSTIFLAILSMIFLLFALKYVLKSKNLNNFKVFNYSMLFAGIIGNLIDRIVRKYVIDFLSFKIFFYNFPVFNIADCFIVISIILILIDMYLEERKCKSDS